MNKTIASYVTIATLAGTLAGIGLSSGVQLLQRNQVEVLEQREATLEETAQKMAREMVHTDSVNALALAQKRQEAVRDSIRDYDNATNAGVGRVYARLTDHRRQSVFCELYGAKVERISNDQLPLVVRDALPEDARQKYDELMKNPSGYEKEGIYPFRGSTLVTTLPTAEGTQKIYDFGNKHCRGEGIAVWENTPSIWRTRTEDGTTYHQLILNMPEEPYGEADVIVENDHARTIESPNDPIQVRYEHILHEIEMKAQERENELVEHYNR